MTSKLCRLTFALFALAPAFALAAVPGSVNFSARVADNGRPLTGSHEFIFRFWDCDGTNTTTCVPDTTASPSANVIWRETQTLTVNDGVAAAALGADSANLFPATLFTGASRWFSVTMDGTDFGPFMAVRSVPFAIKAGNADFATNATNASYLYNPSYGYWNQDYLGSRMARVKGAYTSSYYLGSSANSAWQTIVSTTAGFPIAGYARIEFEASPYVCGNNGQLQVVFNGTVQRSTYWDVGTTPTYPHPQHMSLVMPVPAGTYWILGQFISYGTSTSCYVYHPTLNIEFFPYTL